MATSRYNRKPFLGPKYDEDGCLILKGKAGEAQRKRQQEHLKQLDAQIAAIAAAAQEAKQQEET